MLTGAARITVRRVTDSVIVRNSSWAFAGEIGRISSQALLLILLAHLLEISAFGRFAATCALMQLSAPFLWCGAANLLVQRHARGDASLEQACSTAVTTVVSTGALGTFLCTSFGPFFLPELGRLQFFSLGVSEFLFAGVLEVLAVAGWATERLVVSAALRWTSAVCRLLALAAFAIFTKGTEGDWYVAYALATGLAALIAVITTRKLFDTRIRTTRPTLAQLRQGLSFSFGVTAYMVQDNIDKPLVLRLASPEAAAIYTAAYRITIMSLMPIRAVLQASYARFFRVGASGVLGTSRLARRLAPPMAAYGLVAGLIVGVSGEYLASLFGPGFQQVGDVLWWLAPLPALRAASSFAGDTLTGAGRNTIRVGLVAATAAVNVVANCVAIPLLSWRGAALTTIACEFLLVACLLYAIGRCYRSEALSVSPARGSGNGS